jgi:hypothetical protein
MTLCIVVTSLLGLEPQRLGACRLSREAAGLPVWLHAEHAHRADDTVRHVGLQRQE